jgi:hypothetical protein
MIFGDPTSLSEAVKVLLAKGIMPTSLDTDGLRQLDRALRNQSLFSAETTNAYLLQRYKDLFANLLEPQRLLEYTPAFPGDTLGRRTYSPAYVREEIKKFLAAIGYRPLPEEAGTIKDLSSDARIDLVIKTNTEMAQGQGWWLQGQDDAVLDEWPAQELFRAEGRKVPRDWFYRWQLAGGQTGDPIGTGWTITPEDSRLIALKNHPIWTNLGSSTLFQDGLDQPWPPFAFNSGMWVRDVDRATAEEIGLLKPGQTITPQTIEEALAA